MTLNYWYMYIHTMYYIYHTLYYKSANKYVYGVTRVSPPPYVYR